MPDMIRMSRRDAILAVAFVLSFPACGAKTQANDGGSCHFEPVGAFTFHIHNASTTPLVADLGCSKSFPMTLKTTDGSAAAAPGNVTRCEYTCDFVYSTQIAGDACTDCGPGYLGQIAPGATLDFAWDRRVYMGSESAPECGSGPCARGKALPPSPAQAGMLALCRDGQLPMPGSRCTGPVPVAFTIDTTEPEGTIEVNLP